LNFFAGFRPSSQGLFVSAKRLKTISAPLCPYGFPARFATSGGCATRYAQTVLAEFPKLAALLGHTGRQATPPNTATNSLYTGHDISNQSSMFFKKSVLRLRKNGRLENY
jgi:hypothetical protein